MYIINIQSLNKISFKAIKDCVEISKYGKKVFSKWHSQSVILKYGSTFDSYLY